MARFITRLVAVGALVLGFGAAVATPAHADACSPQRLLIYGSCW